MERTLSCKAYTSDTMFQRERDPIFFRDWFCAGREDEIPMNAVKTLRDEA